MYTDDELKVIGEALRIIPINEAYSAAYDIFARCALGEYYTKKEKTG